MNTSIGQSAARATTAAASAALPHEAIARRRLDRPSLAGSRAAARHAQIKHDAHQVAGLMRARHIDGFILDPKTFAKPGGARQVAFLGHWSKAKAAPINLRQGLIKPPSKLRPGVLGEAHCARQFVR